ncbi:MAG: conserved rane protein of unknown function [Acidimicrobiales bacterium]|nr:conserved rane protein of unknown function [Acidimicrobiales bacterium]
MTRLLVAELRRVLARRLVRMTVLLAAVGLVVGGIAVFATSASLPEATYQQRVRAAEAQRTADRTKAAQCLQSHGYRLEQDIPRSVRDQCAPKEFPTAKDTRFHRSRLESILEGVSGVLAIMGWAIGASLVGAELASRGMTTSLTWETRRGRVLGTKALVAVASVAVLALATLLGLVAVMLPALAAHGGPIGPGDPTVANLAGLVLRGTALAALAAGMGFAIATVGRSTSAALGVGFAYIVVLENILGNSLAGWRRWLLLGNVIVFVTGENSGGDVPGRSVIGAGIFLVAVTITLLVAAAGAFRTRDVA